eukprot:CAMPEP_0171920646 /NCGR_PEP_ID=MMETSP0993-20121228/19415_1 /TAXON_ID=483369 /ORGANISM="non described non described, Strain CCMP2098" /LENGTH=56 /DNA_ID=CAMNT_0012557741 /DNA_START=94 /DNA_END=260 /DNA_ORIENTATION=+
MLIDALDSNTKRHSPLRFNPGGANSYRRSIMVDITSGVYVFFVAGYDTANGRAEAT